VLAQLDQLASSAQTSSADKTIASVPTQRCLKHLAFQAFAQLRNKRLSPQIIGMLRMPMRSNKVFQHLRTFSACGGGGGGGGGGEPFEQSKLRRRARLAARSKVKRRGGREERLPWP